MTTKPEPLTREYLDYMVIAPYIKDLDKQELAKILYTMEPEHILAFVVYKPFKKFSIGYTTCT